VAIAEGPVTARAGFRIGLAPDTNVLWLTGEHDVATCSGLRLVLVDLIALDEHDLTVDLSETLFVGSVVIGELERARQHLLARGRMLTVRAPSAMVRRTFSICNAAHMIESTSPVHRAGLGPACSG
jgi:anti-anti-sigma regulatory factor